MSHYRKYDTFVTSLLIAIIATVGITAVSFAAMSDADLIVIPLPTFRDEDYFLKPHKTPADDKEMPSGNRLPRTLQILRARNLLAAGHYDEAISDYSEGLPNWKVPLMFRRTAEQEFAVAYEKVGKIDEATKHAKLSGSAELLAKLYLKQQRFLEAKAIADNEILDNRISDYDYHIADDLAPWLQFRAVLECHLKRYNDAVLDLREAALKYSESNTEASEICMRATNAVVERYKTGTPFTLEVTKLPAKGKDRVIDLIRYLSSSNIPLDIGELNRITGAHIKLPGKTWRNIHQEETEIRPFAHLEYRSETDHLESPDLLMLQIATDQCCVPKAEIELLFPPKGIKIPPISIWNELDESPYAEAWKLPTGRLLLRFSKSGARILNYLEFNALKADEKTTAEKLRRRAYSYEGDKKKKVDTLTEAIRLDGQMIGLYVDRAKAYCDLGCFSEALADSKRAVALGGRFYLDEQSNVEEKMANFGDAIEHLKTFIGERTPGPETASNFSHLAELYVENKQYQEGLEASEKALLDSKDKSAALFVKAKAEAGLGNLENAKADAKASAEDYFSKAQIILRDRVLDWLKTICASQ